MTMRVSEEILWIPHFIFIRSIFFLPQMALKITYSIHNYNNDSNDNKQKQIKQYKTISKDSLFSRVILARC